MQDQQREPKQRRICEQRHVRPPAATSDTATGDSRLKTKARTSSTERATCRSARGGAPTFHSPCAGLFSETVNDRSRQSSGHRHEAMHRGLRAVPSRVFQHGDESLPGAGRAARRARSFPPDDDLRGPVPPHRRRDAGKFRLCTRICVALAPASATSARRAVGTWMGWRSASMPASIVRAAAPPWLSTDPHSAFPVKTSESLRRWPRSKRRPVHVLAPRCSLKCPRAIEVM